MQLLLANIYRLDHMDLLLVTSVYCREGGSVPVDLDKAMPLVNKDTVVVIKGV